jgi:hypothetical protein
MNRIFGVIAFLVLTTMTSYAGAEDDFTLGLALIDQKVAESHLRGITAEGFDKALSDLNLKSVANGVEIKDEKDEVVGTCTIMVGPPSSEALGFFGDFTIKLAKKTLGAVRDNYKAVIIVTYEIEGQDGKREVKSQEFNLDARKDKNRVIDWRLIERFGWRTVKIKIILSGNTIAGEVVEKAFDILLDSPSIINALFGKGGNT